MERSGVRANHNGCVSQNTRQFAEIRPRRHFRADRIGQWPLARPPDDQRLWPDLRGELSKSIDRPMLFCFSCAGDQYDAALESARLGGGEWCEVDARHLQITLEPPC